MNAVEWYIEEQSPVRKKILLQLHHLMAERLGMEAKIRFKIPFYFQRSWVVYLNNVKNDGIEMCFLKGHLMSDEHTLLQSRSRKMVRGIIYYDVKEIQEELVDLWLQEALILDEGV